MPGPLVALAGRLAASRGGQMIAGAARKGGEAIASKGRAAARLVTTKEGRRELKRNAGVFADFYRAQKAGRGGLFKGNARALRKAELLSGVIAGKQYFSGKGKGKGGSEAGAVPSKKSPRVAREVTKPSISAINDQLGDLLKVVTHIRDVSNDRQNTLLKNEVDAVRAEDEQGLESNVAANDNESPDAVQEPTESNSDLGSTFDAFSQALDALTQTIQQLIDGQGGEDQPQSFADAFRSVRNTRQGHAPDRRAFSRNSLAGRGEARLNSIVSRARDGATARLSGVATNVRESAAVTKIGGAIRTTAGAATAKMARGAGTTKDVVRRLAKPILTKALGKTALKSIPIIGAVAGVGFALGKLLDGDFVGAGLEAASGLAGPATAIPAFILSVSRDIYSGVFGIPPEQDPQFAERMPEIQEAVKAEAASIMGPQVETKEGVTSSAGGVAAAAGVAGAAGMAAMAMKAANPTMPSSSGSPSATPTSSSGQPASSPPPSGSPPAAPQAEKTGGDKATLSSGGAPTPSAGPTPSAAPAESATGKGVTKSGSANAIDGLNEGADPGKGTGTTPPPPAQSASLSQAVNSVANAGAKIMEATEKSEDAANKIPMINVGRNGERPRPQRFPTERQGFVGTGNVPNPGIDNLGSIAYQLYFGVAA